MEAGTVDPIKTHALVSRNLMGCDYDLVSECANLSQWIYETSGGQPPIPVSSAIERYDAICIDEGNYAIVRSHAHERDQDSLYVLFCGTKNIGHILSDLNANSSEVHDADANIIACVHAGMYDKARNKFWAIHKQIEQCLKNQAGIKNIIFTGHSLGGGVASLYVFESRLAKTAKRNKKTTVVSSASAIESEVDLTDSDSDWEEDDRPVMMQGDAVPEIFTALLPKNGAVTQTQCDGADFMCDHEWTDVSSAVLRCSACQDVCCIVCLKKLFKVKQKDINVYLKKKSAFVCMKCTVNDIEERKNEKNNKRKKRRRK